MVASLKRPEFELGAGLVPELGNAAREIAWVRMERPCLEPSQKSLDSTVIYLGGANPLGGAPIGEGGEPVRQALVISDDLEQGCPNWVASGAAPAQGFDNSGKLQRGSQKASQI